MRKNVQYVISILNFVFEIAVTFFCFKTQDDPSIAHIDNGILFYLIVVLFSLLPFLFIFIGNLLMKKTAQQKAHKIKVFPIIFVILILTSWVVCIYTNKSFDGFDEYKLNWILIGLGSVVMYVSNSFSSVGTNDFFHQKMQIHISNEIILTKLMKAIVCFFGLGGYIIIVAGAFGFFFKHWLIDAFILFAGIVVMIVLPICYYRYCDKKSKYKRKTISQKNKRSV